MHRQHPSFMKKTKISSQVKEYHPSVKYLLEAVRQTNLESINGNRLLETCPKQYPSQSMGYYSHPSLVLMHIHFCRRSYPNFDLSWKYNLKMFDLKMFVIIRVMKLIMWYIHCRCCVLKMPICGIVYLNYRIFINWSICNVKKQS